LSPDEQNDDSDKTAVRSVPDLGSQETSVSNTVVDPEPAAGGPAPTPAETRTWAPAGGESPATAQARGTEAASDPFNDRPHVWVGAALVGGLVFAQILKRLGGGDDD
jgi:uncharacterized membrane protein